MRFDKAKLGQKVKYETKIEENRKDQMKEQSIKAKLPKLQITNARIPIGCGFKTSSTQTLIQLMCLRSTNFLILKNCWNQTSARRLKVFLL